MIRLVSAKNPKFEPSNKHSSEQCLKIELSNLELLEIKEAIKEYVEETKGKDYRWYANMIEMAENLNKIGIEALNIQDQIVKSMEEKTKKEAENG